MEDYTYLSKITMLNFQDVLPESLTPRPPRKRTSQKERIVFQSKHFKGELLNSQDVTHKKGHYITNPNNTLSSEEILSKLPYICIKFDPPKIPKWVILMTPSQNN